MDVEHVLAGFGETRRQAIREYRRFMTEGLTMGKQPELTGGGLIRSLGGWSQALSQRRKRRREEADERILGSGDFVNAVLKEAEERQIRQRKDVFDRLDPVNRNEVVAHRTMPPP